MISEGEGLTLGLTEGLTLGLGETEALGDGLTLGGSEQVALVGLAFSLHLYSSLFSMAGSSTKVQA